MNALEGLVLHEDAIDAAMEAALVAFVEQVGSFMLLGLFYHV